MRSTSVCACVIAWAAGCGERPEQVPPPTPASAPRPALPAPTVAPADAPAATPPSGGWPVFAELAGDVPLTSATLGAAPAPFGVFAGVAPDAPLAALTARAPATRQVDVLADLLAAASKPDMAAGLGSLTTPALGPDGLYAATGLVEVAARLEGDPLTAICYRLPASKLGVVAQAWQAHAAGTDRWFAAPWRADAQVLTAAAPRPDQPALAELCLRPSATVDAILQGAAAQLGRPWGQPTLGAGYQAVEEVDPSRFAAEAEPAAVTASKGTLPSTDVCAEPSHIALRRGATTQVEQVDLSLCVDDEAARQRAFASMERRWGRARSERTDDGRVSLVFRRGPLQVLIARQGQRGDAEPFELIFTAR